MNQDELKATLRGFGNGQTINVSLGGRAQAVTIISADADGFVCRPQSESGDENSGDFWIANDELASVG